MKKFFFSDHFLIVDLESSSESGLAVRQFWKFSDCTHNVVTNSPSLEPGSALGGKGEKKIGVGEINNQRAQTDPER